MSYTAFSPFLVMISVMPITSLVSLAIYVFRSLGLYSMAENTGVPHPWMAWLPITNQYLLGRLADRYNGSQGKQSSYRILLPAVQCGGRALVGGFAFLWLVELSVSAYSDVTSGEIVAFFAMVLLALVVAAASAVVTVLCSYKVFLDYEPTSAVGYTVLAFFNLIWIPLFLCRNNVPTGIAGQCSPKQPRYQMGTRRL